VLILFPAEKIIFASGACSGLGTWIFRIPSYTFSKDLADGRNAGMSVFSEPSHRDSHCITSASDVHATA
jgi:hypothetical protein